MDQLLVSFNDLHVNTPINSSYLDDMLKIFSCKANDVSDIPDIAKKGVREVIKNEHKDSVQARSRKNGCRIGDMWRCTTCGGHCKGLHVAHCGCKLADIIDKVIHQFGCSDFLLLYSRVRKEHANIQMIVCCSACNTKYEDVDFYNKHKDLEFFVVYSFWANDVRFFNNILKKGLRESMQKSTKDHPPFRVLKLQCKIAHDRWECPTCKQTVPKKDDLHISHCGPKMATIIDEVLAQNITKDLQVLYTKVQEKQKDIRLVLCCKECNPKYEGGSFWNSDTN